MMEIEKLKERVEKGLVDLADIHSELVSTLDNSGDIWVKDITN
jgi:DNA polymerase III delta subunit